MREYWLVDPAAGSVEILTRDGDAFRTAQLATGDEVAASRLLGNATFPLETIFAGVGEPEP